ncbi:hypothetical protein CANINC_001736 [Pichia inconspicua]|uniref:Uncharacterized protein n=1 Tax=Pichia inconspicua TaxID=52247 RepID=A0A4T0X2S6_9ASCO|nr:hypothetical protein CANINC_001736 [[Candida] inconspicua]
MTTSNVWPLVQESDEEYIYNLLLDNIKLNSSKYGASYIQTFWESNSSSLDTKAFTINRALQVFKSADFNPVIFKIIIQISKICCISSVTSGGLVTPDYIDVRINNVTITKVDYLKRLIDISLGTLEVIWRICKLDDHIEIGIDDPTSTFIPKILTKLLLPQNTPIKKLPVAIKILMKSKLRLKSARDTKLCFALSQLMTILSGHTMSLPDSEDAAFESLDKYIMDWKTYVNPMKDLVSFLEWSSMLIQCTEDKAKTELLRELNLCAYQDRSPDYADIDLLPNVTNLANKRTPKFVYDPYAPITMSTSKKV